MSLDNKELNKKVDHFKSFDMVLKWARITFILILLSPFAFYVSTKINFDKAEPKSEALVESEVIIENGIELESGLIVADGYEVVKVTCGACHALDLVTQNRATREGWKDLIVWMQKTQKLWDLGESEKEILDYLEKNYAPEKKGRRTQLTNIEWYEL